MDSLNLSETTSNTGTAFELGALTWGQSYLMCPPDHFGVLYEINPWMHRDVVTDKDLAYEQWHNLVNNIEKAGGMVATMEPVESLPDIVFVANAGMVDRHRFVVSRFRYPERQPEAIHDAAWFQAKGFEIIELSLESDAYFEGCGDVFPLRNRLLAGYGFRTDHAAHVALGKALGVEVLSVKLIDPRFYHLDLSFCPLDERRAIIAPNAWDVQSCEIVKQLVPEPLVLELDEALTFCANSIVVGKVVIMPHCPLRVGRILERWGYHVCVSPVSEFLKAGGGVRCLTLALDATLQ
jgi:arginine dihydrolase